MRTEREYTMPLNEITAISVVPPPISTTMLPLGSVIGSPAPIAATIACSTRCTSLALARYAESMTARFSTCVISEGTPITMRGCTSILRMHQHLAVVRLLDEIVQHLLGDLEVCDDAILHGLNGDDVARGATKHLLGL